MADLFLRGRRVLEPGRRGAVRLPDQSTHRAVLYAGPEYNRRARPRCLVRGLWNAGNRVDVVLPARYDPAGGLEIRRVEFQFLGIEYRPGADDCAESPAG